MLLKCPLREFYLQLCFFGIVHFTNLTALNNWVKSAFASVMALVILGCCRYSALS